MLIKQQQQNRKLYYKEATEQTSWHTNNERRQLENASAAKLIKASSNSPSQLNIPHHHGNSFRVDRAQISRLKWAKSPLRIFEDRNQISFGCTLKCFNRGHCPAQLLLRKALGYLFNLLLHTIEKLTNLAKGSLRIRSSVEFWYFRISWRAFTPGRYRFFLVLINCEVSKFPLLLMDSFLAALGFRFTVSTRAIVLGNRKK